jgi:hypothetical protein
MTTPDDTFLPKQKQAERYGVTSRTIDRWSEDAELGYPPAYDFNGRPFRKLSDLETWERSRAVIAAANRAARRANAA